MPLLEKPKGGLSPILLVRSFVRVWERLRRPQVDDFLGRAQRPYWAFGVGQSAEVSIWQRSVRAEGASEKGEFSAGFTWGGTKYYESSWLQWLRDRA
eukprot:8820572-Pyramimonas_sp.AAC.1